MRKIIFSVFIMMIFLASCGKNPDFDSDKFTVAVSIPPQVEFVRKVCGDRVQILNIIPSGYSPEIYEPAPRDIVALSKADIYFTIGVPAEKSNILPETENIKTVSLDKAAAEKFDELKIGGERDPHIWLSPQRVIEMIKVIADEMGKEDSENKDFYISNAEAYINEINQADEYARKVFSESGQKNFIVFHPAFSYFADEYGLVMHSLESDGKEVTALHLAEMVDFAKEKNIKAVFYQQETDSGQAEAFADEIGGVTVELSPLAVNYTENIKLMADTIAKGCNR